MSGVVDSGRVNRDTRLPTALALWTTRSRRRRRRRAAVSHGKRGARCAEIAHGSNEDFGLRRRPTDPARCARLPDGTPHPRRTTPCRAASLHARQPAADVSPTSFGGARGGSALQDCLTSPFSIPPSRAGARRSLRLSAEVAQIGGVVLGAIVSNCRPCGSDRGRALRVASKRCARAVCPSLAGPSVLYRTGRRRAASAIRALLQRGTGSSGGGPPRPACDQA